MSGANGEKAAFGAVKGMLYMRIQELTTTAALVRFAIIAASTFGLLLLVGFNESEARERFQGLLVGAFALKFLPIFCLTKGGETLRGELKDGTIEYLWVRPASKVELYLGFFLSGFLGTMWIVGPALIGISAAGVVLGVIGVGGLLTVWVVSVCVVASFTALSGAIGAFSSKFVVLGIFYYSFVELGLASIPNGVQKLAVSYHAENLLRGVTFGAQGFEVGHLLWIAGIGAVALGLGAAIFSQSHYVVGSEKEA
ncbi:ABC transporter permease subunit [Pelagicoccus mobilis]|uniref:Uncharacterized protein n=1 Tax=Pelagicoccus mobilis TaxID=415221 RepID=A0A934RWF1_9BACT|nr:ABC transporter permease subunit [Pelagicoccus mobilis]MBK1877736.1 hypothetical protein [Pelagicoccus mobilis]